MGQKYPDDVEELLRRATGHRPKAKKEATQSGRRQIYNGDSQNKSPGYAVPPANRRHQQPKRRRSTFNIVMVLFGIAVGLVAYISNILAVKQLVVEVHQLRNEHTAIVERNKLIDAERTRKASLARIKQLAQEQLGMIDARSAEIPFDVDNSKLEDFKVR